MSSFSNLNGRNSEAINELMYHGPHEPNPEIPSYSSNFNVNTRSLNFDLPAAESSQPIHDNGDEHRLISSSNNQALGSEPLSQRGALDSAQQKNEVVQDKSAGVPELPKILKIEPATEVLFTGPFNKEVAARLWLTNPTNELVFFKLKKTTAPLRYSVRPNCGSISARNVQSIVITLKPQERDLVAEANLHKFMLQSCYAPENFADGESINDFMKSLPTDQISETVLQCNFVSGTAPTPIGSNSNDNLTPQSSARDALNGFLNTTSEQENERNQQLITENERLRQQLANLETEFTQLRLRSVATQSSVDHATSVQPQRTGQLGELSDAIMLIVVLLIGLMFGRFLV